MFRVRRPVGQSCFDAVREWVGSLGLAQPKKGDLKTNIKTEKEIAVGDIDKYIGDQNKIAVPYFFLGLYIFVLGPPRVAPPNPCTAFAP